jgi:hypothetical protein
MAAEAVVAAVLRRANQRVPVAAAVELVNCQKIAIDAYKMFN